MPIDFVMMPSVADDPALHSREFPGWWGKLAGLGDFSQRRLDPDFIRVADDWLSAVMQAAMVETRPEWLSAYLTAPVLRFAWPPGVVGDHWWFGVLMPSCDNVGRYFPLLVAQRRTRPPQDRIALDHLEAWFDHLARAAARTLDPAASLDDFEAQLREAPPWHTPGRGASLACQPLPAGGEQCQLEARRATLNEWVRALSTESLLQNRLAGHSIWWPQTHAGDPSRISMAPGLPEPSDFVRNIWLAFGLRGAVAAW